MKNNKRFIAVFSLFALLCMLAVPAVAQEARGTIQGTVTDPKNAVVPGVNVVVTNVATNASRAVTSNEIGYYEMPLLDPGSYTITAEIPGFKKHIRQGVTLNVGSRIAINIQLEVIGVEQTITVTESAPLLETTTASSGRVIDGNLIASLPFSDLNPFALSGMAAGMQWTGQPEYRRPFDNGGTSSFNTMGGVGQNEYTIDGAPVTGTGRRVGFVPPADAIQEFNLQTASFDASVGHTSGALVNVVSRAGSNNFHGALYDQHWQQRWNATPHFSRLLFEDAVRQGKSKPDDQRQGPGRSNQFGATIGGPVRIPWIFNGKDKLFFFFSYNGIYQKKAETTDSINRSVPKMKWREGDFSDLLAIDKARYQIYDPRTARLVSGRVVRDPFPGNIVPSSLILNPMYKFYRDLYPKPNDVPGLVSAEGANNYLAAAMPKDERFNSILNRIDYRLSDRHSLNGKWYWNHRLADEYDWAYETLRGLMRNGLTRINKGGSGDYIWTVNNANVFQLGLNYTRFNEGSQRDVPSNYKPGDVGLPGYLDQKAGDLHLLPRLDFDSIEDVSQGYAAINIRGTTAELKASMNTIRGKHSLKYGYAERRYWAATGDPGYTSGVFTFRNSYMRSNDADTVAAHRGLEWAAFMMGVPNGISIDSNDSALWSTRWRALYLQDDWRATRKLTFNLGLRYEREGGTTERFNRGIDTQFIFDAKLPITDPVQAAYATVYAANPGLGLPAPADFKILGGIPYLGQNNKTWTNGTHRFLPRIGVAYQVARKTVIRAGTGWFADTLNVNNDRPDQWGFSKGTSTVITTDNGQTFLGSYPGATIPAGSITASKNLLTDPFPTRADGTRFDSALGNKLGIMSRAGQGYGLANARDRRPPIQQRWRVGVQQQLMRDFVIEASYSGAFSKMIAVTQRLDFLPAQYWATGNVRVQAVDDDLNRTLTNPFNIRNLTALQSSDPVLYNYLSTVGLFAGTTTRKNTLLRAYPHMSGLNGLRQGLDFADAMGSVRYHDVEFRAEKRFSRGFSSTFSWTRVFHSTTKDFYANEFDTALSERPSNNTRPNRFIWDAVLELPFGKGRKWLQTGPLQHAAGGWEVGFIGQQQDGQTTGWGNRFFYGDLSKIGDLFNHDATWNKDLHQWFDPSIVYKGTGAVPAGFTGFEGRSANQPGSYHVRVFPTRLEDLREPGIKNWDIKLQRKFKMTEAASTSFSVDFLNAFNHTNFSGPNTDPTSTNFGKLTSQRGLSRTIQFNLRIVF